MKKRGELSYSVPDDFSLIGFDDIKMVQFTNPPVVTIQVDRKTMGQGGVQLLLDQKINKVETLVDKLLGKSPFIRKKHC